ncbi:MAG: Gfo/Idh/MocA family oxidoreductase [Actinomycetota bacterium]
MANEQHGVAVIGLGTVGLRYVEQFLLDDRFTVVGGHDSSTAAAGAARERFGIDTPATADELIADPRVDVVYVAVPPVHHAAYVDRVVAAGRALLCEKPLGVDEAESVAMVERVAGTAAAVNFVFGAAPAAVALLDDVRATGTELLGVDLRVHFERWPRPWQAGAGWLRDRDQGGWTREVVSHFVFLAGRLLGPLAIERSAVRFPDDGTSERWLTAELVGRGVPVRVVGSSDAAGADEVELTIRGVDRSWRLTNWYGYSIADAGEPWRPGLDADAASGPAAYAAQLGQLAALVEGRSHSLATFAEALEVQRIVEALVAGDRPDARR